MFDAEGAAGAGANTAGTAPDPQAMFADLAAQDPRMAMLMQFMQPRAAQKPAEAGGEDETANDEAPDEVWETVDRLSQRLAEVEQALERMTAKARRLYIVGRSQSARLSDLAAALGACGTCWGEDPACPACRGRGRPGMVRPDTELRARLLGPLRTHRNPAEHDTPLSN